MTRLQNGIGANSGLGKIEKSKERYGHDLGIERVSFHRTIKTHGQWPIANRCT